MILKEFHAIFQNILLIYLNTSCRASKLDFSVNCSFPAKVDKSPKNFSKFVASTYLPMALSLGRSNKKSLPVNASSFHGIKAFNVLKVSIPFEIFAIN